MNFLAHALLAGDEPLHRVGGVAGDFFKGPLAALEGRLPPALLQGVRLHRCIDMFAEGHGAFCASRARVGAGRRRYAGILVDMFYDHLLARDWSLWHAEDLRSYCAGVYRDIEAARPWLPEAFLPVFERMAGNDWLAGYAELAGLEAAIERMARYRLRPGNPLAGGVAELTADPAGFGTDFKAFLPDALDCAAGFRARLVAG